MSRHLTSRVIISSSALVCMLAGRAAGADAAAEPASAPDHAGIIQSWNHESLARGEKIYRAVCVTCHGDLTHPGSLPGSRPFWKEPFKNGSDPFSLFRTLTNGLGQMPAWTFLSVEQRYDAIHFLREAFVRTHNPGAYFAVTREYLATLPKGSGRGTITEAMRAFAAGPPYQRMDFGPVMFWTFEVEPGNIAYKGIAVRLDPGPGGISKGRNWILYDHDTLRVAAAWTGEGFVDWRGIAFDGSHQTHTSIVGQKAFHNPPGPGWARPGTRSFDDPRLRGRDNKTYGPLPRDWAHLHGVYLLGSQVIVSYSVGDARVLESPGCEAPGGVTTYSRTFNIGRSSHDLLMRVAPASTPTALVGDSGATLITQHGFTCLQIPALATPLKAKLLISGPAGDNETTAGLSAAARGSDSSADLALLTRGGPPQWNPPLATRGRTGNADGPFAVDEISAPPDPANPWHTWMRFTGFDFFEDGRRAAIATWNGDVWTVDGIDGDLEQLIWRRIASGLFQPLGVKIVDGVIHVTCRDQIARLEDLNGDGEIDFIGNFNNDHQVTEHFHEFAMGLQTDREGNFYYAKSARHALPALVPHHGTLLKVTRDGSRTEIVATGFRAANGVCVNDDGSFFVTDQEGHWTPKNRINAVRPGGFYGNMLGFHDRSSAADDAMEQPLVWITNEMDRSPGELLRVTSEKWGPLQGLLLNLSYGTGRIFVVPHENVGGLMQGGVVALPIPDFPTGVMRGRFHPGNGHLYACGMYAWAGNRQSNGGFFRVRATGKPAHLPMALQARTGGLEISFTDPLDPKAAQDPASYAVKVWGLHRSADYGSKHIDERRLAVTRASLSPNHSSVFLEMTDLKPTRGMEISFSLRGANGRDFKHTLHNTIHTLDTATPAPTAATATSALPAQSPPPPKRATSGPPAKLVLPGESFTAGGRPAFVFLPPAEKRRNPQPWIFYAPTLPAYPDEAERWMHERFLAAGIAVAGVDVGEAYGSPKSHDAFEALHRELVQGRGFAARPCLFGRSRGGLWASSWAIAHPSRVAGLIGIYPVFDFRTYPGLAKAAPAYGLTPAELAERADQLNPVSRIDVLAKARVPAMLIHGDVDTVVPIEENSRAFVRAYKSAGAESLVKLIVLEGQGHNFFEGFFRAQELVDFGIARALAGATH